MEELVEEEYWSRNFEDSKYYEDLKYYEGEGKLRWIWRKGVDLGKKMVVTSVVVSSAPFVLPPLVALSAIGFAFSLPAGFMIASYACTDKLMTTLLPMPSQPPYLEWGTISSDEEEYRDGDEVDKGYEEDEDNDDDIVAEEKGSEEDTREVVEMKTELVEDGYKDISCDHCELPVQKDKSDTMMGVSGIVEEGGYEEDVGEYMEAEEQNLDSTAVPSIMEGIREAEDEIPLMEREGIELPKDSLGAFVLEAEVSGENESNVEHITEELVFLPPRDVREQNGNKRNLADIEEDELREETTGLLQRIRDEGRDDHYQYDSLVQGKRKEDEHNGDFPIKNVSESGELFGIPEEVKPAGPVRAEDFDNTVDVSSEDRNVTGNAQVDEDMSEERGDKILFVIPEEVKPATAASILATDYLDETVGGHSENAYETGIEQEQPELVRAEDLDNTVDVSGENRNATGNAQANEDMSQERGDKNLFIIPEEVKPAGIVGIDHLDETVGGPSENVYETAIEQEQPGLVIERMLVVNVKTFGDHTATDVHQGTGSHAKLGTIIFSSVDAMETGDESGLGDRTEVPDRLPDSLDKMPEGDNLGLENAMDVRIDYHKVLVESVATPEYAKTGMNRDDAADKETVNEDKIWEQIRAVQTIVGYKTTPHPSCVEELKALYAFTGVEPPVVSSKDSPSLDLADVNEKLHFLMSIIGVK